MSVTVSSFGRPGRPVIERASPTDRAFLAMDSGEVPEQFGVILRLDRAGGFGLTDARRLIALGASVKIAAQALAGSPAGRERAEADLGTRKVMVRIEGAIVIGRPVDVVFDYVADQSN